VRQAAQLETEAVVVVVVMVASAVMRGKLEHQTPHPVFNKIQLHGPAHFAHGGDPLFFFLCLT
jgi:hypothetical protein